LDSVALPLADIRIAADPNRMSVLPVKLGNGIQDDYDRFIVDTDLATRPASKPEQSENFAYTEDFKSEGRIQPVLDFPPDLSADNRPSAANQPSIDNPDDCNPIFQPANHLTGDAHGMALGNTPVVGEPILSAPADPKIPRLHEQPVGTQMESLSTSKWPQANSAQANPYLSRLVAVLICTLIICTAVLGYVMLEIKTELAQLNGQLGGLTSRTKN